MRFHQNQGLVVATIGILTFATSSFENNAYDHIVVGGGPSGIITAERFVDAGKKVLLLERGTGPTVSTSANETLHWDDSLTPIHVPGLSRDIATFNI